MLLMQKERDRRAGLNTAGFISGYRGSPLGGLDLQIHPRASRLETNDIVFKPGLNEDLAATASGARSRPRCAAKAATTASSRSGTARGPASTARGDALRHANLAGTSRHGGVLALMGDDHTAESSTTAHQIRIPFRRRDDADPQSGGRAGNPRLRALRLCHEPLLRQLGRAQMVKDNIEIDGLGGRLARAREDHHPADFAMPPGGLNIRPNDAILGQEERLQELQARRHARVPRANKLNRMITSGGPNAKIGIITTGKMLSRRAAGLRRSRHRRGARQ